MNVRTLEPRPAPVSKPTAVSETAPQVLAPVRHLHRERDFGVGYGNSSGYASQRRYTSNWAPQLFRCA